MIDATASTTATASSSSSNALNQLSADYESFLTLLTAQITNQDPLAPMDSTTFVTQLAQLSQVEQTVETNANLEAISAQMGSIASLSGLSLIGRTVTAPGDQVALTGDGAIVPYRLENEAYSVSLSILDESGTVVKVMTGLPTGSGTMQNIGWDGTDQSGNVLPEGVYTAELTALDTDGEPVGYELFGRAEVQRISYNEGLATLELANGTSVLAGYVEVIE